MYDAAPHHSAIWAQELAGRLRKLGFSDRQIFRDTGLTAHGIEGNNPSAPASKIALLFENAAELTDDDLLGFELGHQREMRRNGLITYVGLSSPTVLDYVTNISRYVRVFSDAIALDISDLTTTGLVTWRLRMSDTVPRRQHNEFQAVGLIHNLRQVTGREFLLPEVGFRHSRNRNLDVFRRFFGGEVQFGAHINSVRFRLEDLNLPLHTADQYLHKVLVETCEDVLARKRPMLPSLVLQVERTVAAMLSSGQATQDKVAAELGLSRRTLSRRLAEHGTSFHRIVEDLRKSLAVNYLRDSDLPQYEIAYLLGYSELSSYITAFKRWTGTTPGQFRKA